MKKLWCRLFHRKYWKRDGHLEGDEVSLWTDCTRCGCRFTLVELYREGGLV